ncbi:MAG TPA: glycogen debranching protein GlgX [Polyangia bacterium]|jgi:glycogen operon protein
MATPAIFMMPAPRVRAGRPYPLGATVTRTGVNFALYSRHATGVRLLLFDHPGDEQPAQEVRLTAKSAFVWHGLVEGLRAGQLYAFRVEGPYQPAVGHRFNPNKVLIDPYAKALHGDVDYERACIFPFDPASPLGDLTFDPSDDVAAVPRAVVVDDSFDWQGVPRPEIAPEDLIIYEVHVGGLTKHPSSKVAAPGTFLGFIEKIPYLKELGVNAVELLPIHAAVTEPWLAKRRLRNYWGYNTISFFAPDRRFAHDPTPGSQVREFKTLVRELHRAGIEVILDVVYNHSGEGNHVGPMLSLRGIDNRTYYRLTAGGRFYEDFTGCGNTLNLSHPAVLRLVMDSLRYFVEVMHVDGFRFDLASALGRSPTGFDFDHISSFFNLVHQDPVISRVRLIAEPWDVGPGGYQLGNFPPEWMEWNGRFRDCARHFWRSDAGHLGELMVRAIGSPDLYGDDGRSPFHSINFVTCHDGFTLRDLVSYERKHNLANTEDNHDGTDDNVSSNWGVEGPCDDPGVSAVRARAQRNYLATLLLSQGIPMLLGGDELGRSQGGNNNAYCQDNEISWFDWRHQDAELLRFVRLMCALRRAHPTLRRHLFLEAGEDPTKVPHLTWYGPDGRLPAPGDPAARAVAFRLDGDGVGPDGEGSDDHLFVIFNAAPHGSTFRLPPTHGEPWRRVLDTSLPGREAIAEPGAYVRIDPPESYLASPLSVVLLISERAG